MNTKKFLHVKNNAVVAITLEGESFQQYGTLVEVPLEDPYGVGDAYPRDAVIGAPVRDLNATKPTGAVPKSIGGAPTKRGKVKDE